MIFHALSPPDDKKDDEREHKSAQWNHDLVANPTKAASAFGVQERVPGMAEKVHEVLPHAWHQSSAVLSFCAPSILIPELARWAEGDARGNSRRT